MKKKDWSIPYTRPCVSPELSSVPGLTPLLCQVLSLRGVGSAAQARELLYGGEDSLYDPLLIRDMDRARARVLRAIETGETVAVYGDYDVDGITATCLLTDYLRSKGLVCHTHIPDRNEEGYGLNCGALEALRQKDVSLLITVDCGITAIEEAAYAKTLGMDMVITDHHECRPDALPDAVAVVDCKRADDRYPCKDLAGVGVAFKLVCACEGESGSVLEEYADLAAIGTIADVMPLSPENRYLVRRGLEQIAQRPRPGIAAILRESAIDPKRLTASTVGFSLAPRLNAAGRLDRVKVAERLIRTRDPSEASSLAHELCELNRQRQCIENDIWRQANEKLSGQTLDGPIVLWGDWEPGVIGIAASRLAEQHSLPAVIICMKDEIGKGSCRSYGGFNLFEALSACSEYLIGFGGHALAAGLNIRRDRLEDFKRALREYYLRNKPRDVAEVRCDLLITDPSLLSLENVRSLDLLEPYGNANPKPVLCVSGVQLESLSLVGGRRHSRMRIRLGGQSFECIYFSHNVQEAGLMQGQRIDMAFTPQINEYRGSTSVQLVASAVRPHDPGDLCERILRGDETVEWACARYCPERADFVRVWRSMGADYAVGADTRAVLAQCPPGMEPERCCLCLMALREAGLLASDSGEIFCARPADIGGKADLEATRLLRSLRSLQ